MYSNELKTIYAIPGLGLDGRIFNELQVKGYVIQPLNYLNPDKDENFSDYVDRMIAQIPNAKEDILLMGHSFGGIIAQEMSHKIKTKGLILLSTIMNEGELPPFLAILRKFPLYDIIKKEVIKRTYFIWGEEDGYNNHEERKIFLDMTDQLSDYYYRWAIGTIVHWIPDQPVTTPVLRIHGDKDLTFPEKYLFGKMTIIPGGSHVVLKANPKAIIPIIQNFIDEIHIGVSTLT